VNKTWVKSAEGRRLRHPGTGKVLPNAADANSAGHPVDLEDPHWYRALQRGDIVVVDAPAAAAPAVNSAGTTEAATTAADSEGEAS
jgi:hypothetical protein